VGLSAKLLAMQNNPVKDPSLPDPVIPNPSDPEVGDPPGPQFAPQPTQPEISEPPAAPVEVPQPGLNRPEAPRR